MILKICVYALFLELFLFLWVSLQYLKITNIQIIVHKTQLLFDFNLWLKPGENLKVSFSLNKNRWKLIMIITIIIIVINLITTSGSYH